MGRLSRPSHRDSDDEALASLLSLLENSVGIETAREALAAANGSVEFALSHIFSGARSSVASSAPPPPVVIDLDAVATAQVRKRSASNVATTTKRPSRPRTHPNTEEIEPPSAADQVSNPLEGVGKDDLWRGPKPQNNFIEVPPIGRWGLHEWLPPQVVGLPWAMERLATDPPCLSLSGNHSDERTLPSFSLGEMHAGDREGWAPRREDFRSFGEQFLFDLTRLKNCFEELLREIRYPPDSLQCSWRCSRVNAPANQLSSEVPQGCEFAPSDLVGQLPLRPFTLLDNTLDPVANQPPRFRTYQLRTEQLRSLSWMLARERGDATGLNDRNVGNSGSSTDSNRTVANTDMASANDCHDVGSFFVEWRRFWKPVLALDAGPESRQLVEGAAVRLKPGSPSYRLDLELQGVVGVLHRNAGELATASVVFISCPTGRTFPLSDLEFVDIGGVQIGCKVQLRPHVTSPTFGWGNVKPSSVGILLAIEGDKYLVNFPEHRSWRGLAEELYRLPPAEAGYEQVDLTVEVRAQAAYNVRGGILADKIGYGKTATTIALIDSTLHLPCPPIPEIDRGRFFQAKGTLIIVPSNLLDQWLTEIAKFAWEGNSLRGNLKSGWSPQRCPLKIFAMSNVTPLTKIKASEVAEADIVLCSYRLLFSQVYVARRSDLMNGIRQTGASKGRLADLVKETANLIAGRAKVRSGRTETFTDDWRELVFPVLEMFYWKRIVFDEFHELEGFDSLQQNSLQHLRSHFRWGLTGTPPIDCTAGVIFMASLFRIDLPGYLTRSGPRKGCDNPDLEAWESDRWLAEQSLAFLDRFVRQNTAELPQIALQEHVVTVSHTPEERALYLGQAHDAPDLAQEDAFKSEANVKALERLLKLCSHFQAGGDQKSFSSAREECHRIGEVKEKRVVKARNQVERCYRVIVLLEGALRFRKGAKGANHKDWRQLIQDIKTALSSESDNGANVVKEFEETERKAMSESPETWVATLEFHRPKYELLATYLGPPDSKRGYMEQWKELIRSFPADLDAEQTLLAQARELAHDLRELADAEGSLAFFRRAVQAMASDDSPENRTCSVCLEEGIPLQKLAITPCAHTFCIECLRVTIQSFKVCSICRQALSVKDLQPIAQEVCAADTAKVDATPRPEKASSSKASSSKAIETNVSPKDVELNKYGSKLGAVVKKLQEMRAEDPTTKVILFVQFDDLKRKVASALAEFDIPAVMLQGAVSQRSNVIYDWQCNPRSASFVLLLSLAQSASGTNLTAASHVVFLHPMLAPTAERAIGHELQAIGRARRHGQRRDTVHVWRFVTEGTIEQAITQRHQAALWAREQALSSSLTPREPGEPPLAIAEASASM